MVILFPLDTPIRNGPNCRVARMQYIHGTMTMPHRIPATATASNLYNWYAVDDSRGVCPEGFHVPTDEEWMELESFLGIPGSELYINGFRGTDQGSQLAGNADLWWYSAELVNNLAFGSSGFNALPGGYRFGGSGIFSTMSYGVYFWSSSEFSSTYAWCRLLFYGNSGVSRANANNRDGNPVRCVCD